MGAGKPAKQSARGMAPAAPVFAATAAPTGFSVGPRHTQPPCGSGQAREAGGAVHGTGCAGVRG
ncbi:hypothetical protein C6A77_20260 [Pseudomonas sp. AFG_SD02_1510_Pfu_092]|nr:hypothetical protein C6A77_20260 [Pseudomonas sp. AFG_SD02_1510_Pfu_092]